MLAAFLFIIMANYPNNERSFGAQFQLISTVPRFYNPNNNFTWYQIINNNFYAYVDANKILITKDATGDFIVNTIPKRNEMYNLIAAFYP